MIHKEQVSYELRYKKDIDIYFKWYTIYKNAKKEYIYYHSVQTKLQDEIQAILAKQKAPKLEANLLVRTWFKDLKILSISLETTIK